jgi:hypothetical protein
MHHGRQRATNTLSGSKGEALAVGLLGLTGQPQRRNESHSHRRVWERIPNESIAYQRGHHCRADTPVRPDVSLLGDVFFAATKTAPCLLCATAQFTIATMAYLRGTEAWPTGDAIAAGIESGCRDEVPPVGAGYTGVPCKENKATATEGFGRLPNQPNCRWQANNAPYLYLCISQLTRS